MSRQSSRTEDKKTTSENQMDQWETASQQHNLSDALGIPPFDSYANSTASTGSPSPWAGDMQTTDGSPWASLPDIDGELDSFAAYDTSLPFSPSDVSEKSRMDQHNRISSASPEVVYDAGLFLDSMASNTRRASTPSAATPGYLTAQRLMSDPRLRDVIQTSSEYRRTRRRAQNRSAQHAFKHRQKRREKDLVEQVDAAESSCKTLEAQNRRLKEELERTKGERRGSLPGYLEY